MPAVPGRSTVCPGSVCAVGARPAEQHTRPSPERTLDAWDRVSCVCISERVDSVRPALRKLLRFILCTVSNLLTMGARPLNSGPGTSCLDGSDLGRPVLDRCGLQCVPISPC